MIGTVADLQALLEIELMVPGSTERTVAFVVDTGFAGALSLPPTTAAALSFPFLRRITIGLADGATVHAPVHAATIVWNGSERDVEVVATGERPLLGTELLDGQELVIQFFEGGEVSVEPL